MRLLLRISSILLRSSHCHEDNNYPSEVDKIQNGEIESDGEVRNYDKSQSLQFYQIESNQGSVIHHYNIEPQDEMIVTNPNESINPKKRIYQNQYIEAISEFISICDNCFEL